MTMMYATLTLMAGMIAIMFVATAVSSVVNAIRENEAVKVSLRRNAAL
jgi:ABC-type polysaccharide/polyol phosphate export permease